MNGIAYSNKGKEIIIYTRHSIRKPGYDYSGNGSYFITIVCQNRTDRFGEVIDGKMMLNDAGRMVEQWWLELERKFPMVRCDVQMVMPNHFHAIIHIIDDVPQNDDVVGAALRGRTEKNGNDVSSPKTDKNENDYPTNMDGNVSVSAIDTNGHDSVSLFDIVGWFKTMTTNAYIRGVKHDGWPRFHKRIWQLRYWDIIIRDEHMFENIRNYIINNPRKWEEDRFRSDYSLQEERASYGNENHWQDVI